MRFSIITPSFRSGRWLQLCVASVADQLVDCEHIIQDGGSDDGSLDELNRHGRLHIFVEKDAGMYDALNRGLGHAQGDIVGLLNSDEQYLPGALRMVQDFFERHPQIEMVFGNAVVVDLEGRYLWHRKMLTPTLSHTWTGPLSTLSCATFFRSSLIRRPGTLFDPKWKCCGDGAWILELLKQNVAMAALGEFTSAFTHTGQNLSLDPRAAQEARTFVATAPKWLRMARPLIVVQHRFRRWVRGAYGQKPFDYEIYTRESPGRRVSHHVSRPTSRWRS